VDPGRGKSTSRFVGLEEPPIVTTGLPGRHFILESERRGSIEVGAPIYYRQIRAGEVVAYHLSDNGTKSSPNFRLRPLTISSSAKTRGFGMPAEWM
jgi:paraquat-inducible protein B